MKHLEPLSDLSFNTRSERQTFRKLLKVNIYIDEKFNHTKQKLVVLNQNEN